MSASRLSLAVEQGVVSLPGGPVAAWRPPAGVDLSALPRDRTRVIHGFRPDHDAFVAQGWSVATGPEGPFAASIVFVPRAKEQARDLIARAADLTEGPLIVDGVKTDGIDGLLREIRSRATVGEVLAKAHGKLFAVTAGRFDDWRAPPTRADGFTTAAGLFSADAPDPGSALLARVLPPLKGAVADLGAGWGYLSHAVLTSDAVTELHAVEAEHAALDCARANLPDPRVRLHWADATGWRPPAALDAVVTNPPFHHGRRPDPSLGRAFIAAAGAMLRPAGQFWLVANRHLPYEATLAETFRMVREVEGDTGFKLFHALQPYRPMR